MAPSRGSVRSISSVACAKRMLFYGVLVALATLWIVLVPRTVLRPALEVAPTLVVIGSSAEPLAGTIGGALTGGDHSVLSPSSPPTLWHDALTVARRPPVAGFAPLLLPDRGGAVTTTNVPGKDITANRAATRSYRTVPLPRSRRESMASSRWNDLAAVTADIRRDPWLPFAHCYCDYDIGGGCALLFYRVSMMLNGTAFAPMWSPVYSNVTADVTEGELAAAATSASGGVGDFLERVYFRVALPVRRCQQKPVAAARSGTSLDPSSTAATPSWTEGPDEWQWPVRGPQHTVLPIFRVLPTPVPRADGQGCDTPALTTRGEVIGVHRIASTTPVGELRSPSNRTTTRRWIDIPFTQVSHCRFLMWQQYHGVFEWYGVAWIIWAMQRGMDEIKRVVHPDLTTTTPRRLRAEGPIVEDGGAADAKFNGTMRRRRDSPRDSGGDGDEETEVVSLVRRGNKSDTNRTAGATTPCMSRRHGPKFRFAYRDLTTNVDQVTHVKTVLALSNITLGYERTTVMAPYPYRLDGSVEWPYGFIHQSYWDIPLHGIDAFWRATLVWARAMRRRLLETYPLIRDVTLRRPPSPTLLYDWRPRVIDAFRGRVRGIHEWDEIPLLMTLAASGAGRHVKSQLHATSQSFHEQLTLIRSFKYFLHGEGAFNLWMLVAPPGSTFISYYENAHTDAATSRNQFLFLFNYSINVWRVSQGVRLIAVTRELGKLADLSLLKQAMSRPFKEEVIWVRPGSTSIIDLTPPPLVPSSLTFDDLPLWQ